MRFVVPAQPGKHLVCRPVPVLDERDLGTERPGSGHAQVCIAPAPDPRVPTEIFVADVVAADPGGVAVHDDGLAVVAEIELKAIARPLAAVERQDIDVVVAQFRHVGGRQAEAADLVIQEIDVDAPVNGRDQSPFEGVADVVVIDDVELHQHVVLCRVDAGEYAVERGFAIDQ